MFSRLSENKNVFMDLHNKSLPSYDQEENKKEGMRFIDAKKFR